MIRVCHIISGDLWAGVEVMSYHLLKCLKPQENLELSAILLNEGRLANEIRGLGIHVDVVDETQRNIFQIIGDVRKILTRRSIDIVHSHRYKENVLAFLASRYGNGIRLVGTQHGMPEILGTNRNWKYMLLHRLNIFLLLKSFSRVIAVSTDIQRIFMNYFGFPIGKIAVVHNGTDIPDELPSAKGKVIFVIGSMGRFFPVKDYILMVEIARQVSLVTDKIRFELAGDGPDRAKIEEAVEKHRLGHMFQLPGTVEDLPCFYRGIDLYLNTSRHEGIPMTVLEAMSYGIPVVAPNVGGLKEMLEDGKEGYLVDGRDPKEFSRRCLHLYENGTLRESMGALARERVEKEFSTASMAREYDLIYQELARDAGSGGRA
jgi:glycosyltransferase involved in cell wall biosynthesis